MKKKKIIIIGLIILFLIGFFGGVAYASSITKILVNGKYNYDMANEVIKLTNEERAKAGLAPLEVDYELTKYAQERAKEASIFFSHTRPNGQEEIFENASFYWGENIHSGGNASTAVKSWMKSPGHRSNILDESKLGFKYIGVGSFTAENGRSYYVQIFSSKKQSNSKIFTGTKELKDSPINIRMSNVSKFGFSNIRDGKKLKIGEEFTIEHLTLRDESNTGGGDYNPISKSQATWTSSNTKVATVDKNGVIKAISAGTTTIKARIGISSASVKITVNDDKVLIKGITASETNIKLVVGDTKKINAKVYPSNTTEDKTLSYSVDDSSIATVDKNGNIKALKVGKTNIIVSTKSKKKLLINVEVAKKEIMISDFDIPNYKHVMTVGESQKLNATIKPDNATEVLKWYSSDTSIATVDENGNVYAVKAGIVRIEARSKSMGTTVEIAIKDKEVPKEDKPKDEKPKDEESKEILIESVKLNCDEITLKIGDTFHFEYETFPKNATEVPRVSWSGVYYEIAELDRDNTIHAKQAGEGTVAVWLGKNSVTDSCKVKVIATDEVQAIEIVPRHYGVPLTVKVDSVLAVVAKITPVTATVYHGITWTSSDTSIATIDENGYIRPNKPGVITITATALNGVYATKEITITE